MVKPYDEIADKHLSKADRAQVKKRAAKEIRKMRLAEIRELVGKSQRQLASEIGIKQPSLSKIENQDDLQLSTLFRIVSSIGGSVRVAINLPGHSTIYLDTDRLSVTEVK